MLCGITVLLQFVSAPLSQRETHQLQPNHTIYVNHAVPLQPHVTTAFAHRLCEITQIKLRAQHSYQQPPAAASPRFTKHPHCCCCQQQRSMSVAHYSSKKPPLKTPHCFRLEVYWKFTFASSQNQQQQAASSPQGLTKSIIIATWQAAEMRCTVVVVVLLFCVTSPPGANLLQPG